MIGRRAWCLAALAAAPSARAAGRSVLDMAGRRVELPARIQRIVTLGSLPVLNTFVFAFGRGHQIVNGLADFDRPHWKFQHVFAPQLRGQPTMQHINRDPIPEALLRAEPDVVLTMHREPVQRLAALGLKVIFLNWREPEDVKACITLLGQVFAADERARAYRRWFDGTLERVRQSLHGLAVAERPRALYLQPETLTQPRLIAEWWIPAAGGTSVSADGRRTETRTLTLEQVLAWDPDRLFLTTTQALRRVTGDAAFAGLRAARNGRLHVVPTGAHTWSNRTAEQPLTVLWATRALHPTRVPWLDLAAEAERFYADFFGVRLSGVQIAEILGGAAA
jgi:iron complex transport system substrate-binding protein